MTVSVFQQRFRDGLTAREWTYVDAARCLNVSRATIHNWLSGKTEPQVTMLVQLAKEFSVSCDYLLGLTDAPVPVQKNKLFFDERLLGWCCERVVKYLKEEGLYRHTQSKEMSALIIQTYKVASQRAAENAKIDMADRERSITKDGSLV